MMIKFGTDGWRGVIADDFTFDRLWLVACAISRYVVRSASGDPPRMLVGYDTRFNSGGFAELCAVAASRHGIDVKMSGSFVSTPSISYATVDLEADGAIMITASHNPARYSGIKFKAAYGGSATGAITASIEEELRRVEEDPPPRPDFLFEDVLAEGGVELFDPVPRYLDKVVSMVDADVFPAGDIKVVFDPMYGAGQGLFTEAMRRLGMDCLEIHGVHNPLFPGLHPEPIGDNLDGLKEAVVSGGCNVGIAVDGDADRVTAVDATGRFISSHMVFALLLKHLVEVRGWSGDVVKTVSTTTMIDRLCDRYGLELHVVPVGFKYICDLMLEQDILMGGEESGGTGIKNYIPERDGILVGLLLVEIIATHGKTLGQLVDELMDSLGRRFVYLRRDMELTRAHKEALLENLGALESAEIGGQEVTNLVTIDGLKFHRADGSWLMLRVSGTEAVVRVYAEAASQQEVEDLIDEGARLIDEVAPGQ
ncbi:MAG: phosphoglucomutase/phosphomannomutase family protein [Actinobacteria bacterium]|nr:phosphoglucomutase/phosphomannomutase family protein [Actinomycetota bacterium]MBU4357999.1 phosphoglucomutase/phosphomannomutase family protein [Actinomycetota bacterium]MBU4391819.1 phosphoglucomutase/phosphomannomutase family protein [Actinomycetota bacterium]MBU4401230.1 phosphoglucomutase/phosphomannomutase family protein [Actinomycetota bacterium]MBU4443227.1 phosphoglucomutase/phosphomannomutase family protein [Actinomycetota bacterium]